MIGSIFVFIIKVYKNIVSPFLGVNCRFIPSCSEYAIQSLKKYGVLKGTFFACWRIIRCNPLNKGGFDPA